MSGPDVRVTLALSCGCRTRPSPVLPAFEATHPGAVIICDRCDEYAVITRVTSRLADMSATALARLLLASGLVVDRTVAEAIGSEQARA